MVKKNPFTKSVHYGISFAAFLAVSQMSFASEYQVDPSHSNVDFEVRHLVSKVQGHFNQFEGKFTFDPKNPEASAVTAEVVVNSINTNEKKRDEHLKSEDFFASKKFPKMSFKSTKVTPDGEKKYKIMGDLTLHGVTKPVTFDAEYLGNSDDPWGMNRAGFLATAKINRKDFGMIWNKILDNGGYLLGDDVTIHLNIEGMTSKGSDKK